MTVLICGGGVIGACIAYFLSLRGFETVVVERAGVANAASGKSGGFLARDWCDGTPVAALARRGFDLHAELAQGSERDWGYRRVGALGVVVREGRDVSHFGRLAPPDWLGADSAVHGRLSTPDTTAQIHPAAFTEAMMAGAIERGARLVKGCVQGFALSPDGKRAAGAIVDNAELTADAVIVAMGPWSLLACRWLPLPAVFGVKAHSLVFDYEPSPESLFADVETEGGEEAHPEFYPRPDGTTYVCGSSGDEGLPVDPADVAPEPHAVAQLRRLTACVSPDLAGSKVLAEQACFRPVTADGLPLIGPVPGVAGAYVATGHSVWGMLNGPSTGEAMADLIADGAATTVDLQPFDPARLEPFDPEALRA
ncbi:MAG: FAD-binding oxidoreductase [Rhodospirillaceae bacterium]|nr:FAD-binding oxidoreductase [Rhodospirillaceae bacterium]MYH37294.1 FAD-binding oxidoreductase [Rhodospirillaceae bacterium]MYK15521.1 FAD-binding oxidoreductase [Rhodospirillaceae bacterium]MYK58079.1 FAD-binding oxidoreductase [Rhodospirillaceae bacterium]